MRKITCIIIILIQLIFIINPGLLLSDMFDNNSQIPTIKKLGLYSLFIVVCDNTTMSLRNLSELAGLCTGIPKPIDNEPKNNDEKTDSVFSFALTNKSNTDIKARAFLCEHFFNSKNISYNKTVCLIILALVFCIFLYLLRLKFFYLAARRTIAYISILLHYMPLIWHTAQIRGFLFG